MCLTWTEPHIGYDCCPWCLGSHLLRVQRGQKEFLTPQSAKSAGRAVLLSCCTCWTFWGALRCLTRTRVQFQCQQLVACQIATIPGPGKNICTSNWQTVTLTLRTGGGIQPLYSHRISNIHSHHKRIWMWLEAKMCKSYWVEQQSGCQSRVEA